MLLAKEDILPEDSQMLHWIEEAAQCNNFRFMDADGRQTAVGLARNARVWSTCCSNKQFWIQVHRIFWQKQLQELLVSLLGKHILLHMSVLLLSISIDFKSAAPQIRLPPDTGLTALSTHEAEDRVGNGEHNLSHQTTVLHRLAQSCTSQCALRAGQAFCKKIILYVQSWLSAC